MNFIIFSLLLVIISITGICQGRNYRGNGDSKNAIQIRPIALVLGGVAIGYERLLNSKHGIMAEPFFPLFSKENTSNYGLTMCYRYHFKKEMKSFFLGTYIKGHIFQNEVIEETPWETNKYIFNTINFVNKVTGFLYSTFDR